MLADYEARRMLIRDTLRDFAEFHKAFVDVDVRRELKAMYMGQVRAIAATAPSSHEFGLPVEAARVDGSGEARDELAAADDTVGDELAAADDKEEMMKRLHAFIWDRIADAPDPESYVTISEIGDAFMASLQLAIRDKMRQIHGRVAPTGGGYHMQLLPAAP